MSTTSYPPAITSIASDRWQLLAAGVAHKQNLLTYAQLCGGPVAPASWGHATDGDLYLSWLSDEVGIISMPKRIGGHRVTSLITGPNFITLCRAYAVQNSYPTQPVEELVDTELTPALTPC